MDATRFDALARSLATRLTRRRAIAGGVGVTAGLIGLNTQRAITIAATDPLHRRYTAIREYESEATGSEIKAALKGLPEQIQQIPGFIDYSVIDGAGQRFITISVFVDQDGLDAAEEAEAAWIKEKAKTLLPDKPAESHGPVILRAGIGAGCPCATGTENPCGSDELVCCGNGAPPGGQGICVDAKYGCGESTPTCLTDGADCPEDCAGGLPCDTCCSGGCLGDGTCGTLCKAPGDPCEMIPDHGCCQGYTCFEGICDNPKGCFDPGDPCTTDADCCQGSCSEEGTCYCQDPSRPQIGCSCDPADTSSCGGRPELCCTDTCISPMAECLPPCLDAGAACTDPSECCEGFTCFEGVCDNPQGCQGAGGECTSDTDCCEGSCSESGICYCSDPDRPDIGCACNPADSHACNGRPELCCVDHCISPMANC